MKEIINQLRNEFNSVYKFNEQKKEMGIYLNFDNMFMEKLYDLESNEDYHKEKRDLKSKFSDRNIMNELIKIKENNKLFDFIIVKDNEVMNIDEFIQYIDNIKKTVNNDFIILSFEEDLKIELLATEKTICFLNEIAKELHEEKIKNKIDKKIEFEPLSITLKEYKNKIIIKKIVIWNQCQEKNRKLEIKLKYILNKIAKINENITHTSIDKVNKNKAKISLISEVKTMEQIFQELKVLTDLINGEIFTSENIDIIIQQVKTIKKEIVINLTVKEITNDKIDKNLYLEKN